MFGKLVNRFLPQRVAVLLAVALVSALLLVLTAALPDASFKAGVSLPPDLFQRRLQGPPPPLIISPYFWDILMAIFWISLLLSIGYILLSPEGRKSLPYLLKRIATQLLWVLFFILFLQITLLFSSEPPADEVGEPARPQELFSTGPALEDQLEELAYTAEPPAALNAILTTLFALGLTTLAYLGWRRYRAQRAQPFASLDELSRQAQAAIDELRRGQQVDDVILRCYREMARTVAAQRGVQRGRGVTPREFEREVQRRGMPPRAVERLTRLFEQVRYGNYAPRRRDQMEAVDSLQAIVNACEQLRMEQGRQA